MGGDAEIFVMEGRGTEKNSQVTLFFSAGGFSRVNKLHSSFYEARVGRGRGYKVFRNETKI